METVNQIEINGTNYEIEDVPARSAILAINEKIPDTASSSNLLATVADVNGSYLVRSQNLPHSAISEGNWEGRTATATAVSGYTPVGIVGYDTNIHRIYAFRLFLTGTTISYGLTAESTSVGAGNITVYILYRKNS